MTNPILLQSPSQPLLGREVTHRPVFQQALTFTLSQEGGVSSDPRDPGNHNGSYTAFGVTQPTYHSFRRQHGLPQASVRFISPSEVQQLYYEMFYLAIRGDELPPPIAIALFDTAVNAGPNQAIKLLQKSLSLREDGVIGPRTLFALRNSPVGKTTSSLLNEREQFYRRLAQKSVYAPFLRGWLNRVAALRKELKKTPLEKR